MTKHTFSRAAGVLLAALLALLVGCAAPSDSEVIRETVHAVYDEAGSMGDDERAQREKRDVAVLEWAAEAGHQEPVTEQELRELEQERSSAYGPTNLSFWNFYQEWLAGTEEALRSDIRDGLTEEQVRTFYDDNLALFERQDPMEITVVPWRDGRAGEAYSLTIEEHTVRRLQEAHDLVVAQALELQEGEQVVVEDYDGTQLQIMVDSRTDGGVIPFDEVVQAASSQLATQLYTAELEQRIQS